MLRNETLADSSEEDEDGSDGPIHRNAESVFSGFGTSIVGEDLNADARLFQIAWREKKLGVGSRKRLKSENRHRRLDNAGVLFLT